MEHTETPRVLSTSALFSTTSGDTPGYFASASLIPANFGFERVGKRSFCFRLVVEVPSRVGKPQKGQRWAELRSYYLLAYTNAAICQEISCPTCLAFWLRA
jgi:hypothetical protein